MLAKVVHDLLGGGGIVGIQVKAQPLKQHLWPEAVHSLSDLQTGTLHPKVGTSFGGGGQVASFST